jgi:hypothetical protein
MSLHPAGGLSPLRFAAARRFVLNFTFETPSQSR